MASIPECDTAEHGIWLEPGTRFHSWTVIGTPVRYQPGHRPDYYPCRCQCGAEHRIRVYDLIHEKTSLCNRCKGLGKNNGNYRHGDFIEASPGQRAKPKLYWVWCAMTRRCRNPNTKDWPHYGGRGISVCPEWLDYRTFRAWATTHGYAEGLELDRIDNNGHYQASNCRWVTKAINLGNRRTGYQLSAFGETKSLKAWARDSRCEVHHATLCRRIKAGMLLEQALQYLPALTGP